MSKMPRIIAIYLPQFHETEDNNQWWGKGFTDWETVKTAEVYFQGHVQPHIPFQGNYYDLSQKEVLQYQADLAKNYGVDGFSFYHYYFKDGKKELEGPAENLLKWKDIDMPFCFNWASVSWVRSWSRISGNIWGERIDDEALDGPESRGVLALQDYGGYDDWRKHFEYLLPFFEDRRYIKVDGKPVFIFYNAEDIKVLGEMAACWRTLAKEAGLKGLYLIGVHMEAPCSDLDAAIIMEPRFAFTELNEKRKLEVLEGVRCFEYNDIWNEILTSKALVNYKTYWCGVTGYDDTPRRGRNGECVLNNTPSTFQKNMVKLIHKSMAAGNELLFINAWNEWGEGMYMEPDERHRFAFLEALHEAKRISDSSKEGLPSEVEKSNEIGELTDQLMKMTYNINKFKALYSIVDRWLFLEQDEKFCISSFLETRGIKSVAIYGMASIGKHLLLQLNREGIKVAFGIDRYMGQAEKALPMYRPEEDFPEVDAIIITAYDVVDIKRDLEQKFHGAIYEIEEIINSLCSNVYL